MGAVGVELNWNGGSAVGVSSPGFKRGGGGVLRCESEERAKERTKSSPGVCVVLGRSLEEGGELCPGLSTAASRWRPSRRLWKLRGRVAREEEGQREARGRWRRSSATRGCQRAAN